jgi:type VI secretion system protein
MIPLVVRVEDLEAGGEPEQFAFIKSPVRIGRGVGSTNGSILAGRQVEKNAPVPVGPGAELVIGTFRLTFTRRVTSEHAALPKQMTAFAVRVSALHPLPEREPPPVAEPEPPPIAEPERPIEPPVPDVAAVAAAEAAIEAASLDLDVHYASCRGAWEHMRAAVEAVLGGLDGPARDVAFVSISARYPGIASELGGATPGAAPAAAPASAAPPSPPAPPPPAGPVRDELGAAALQLLTAFSESYAGEAPPATPRDLQLLLERVADVLETFGRSFVELHRGYEEFGSEMGVRAVQSEGVVHRARDASQLLSYLLDLQGGGRERELQRAFADFMLHQVALLRGVVEGGRALLGHLSPDEVSARTPKGMWPLRAAALWKAFEDRFHELADEESALTEVLFGKEFARAYAAIVGGGSGDGSEGPQPRGGRGGTGGRPTR